MLTVCRPVDVVAPDTIVAAVVAASQDRVFATQVGEEYFVINKFALTIVLVPNSELVAL